VFDVKRTCTLPPTIPKGPAVKLDRKRLTPLEWAAALTLLVASLVTVLAGLVFVAAACSAAVVVIVLRAGRRRKDES
jgi:Flp pilus assembly protein TadB